LRATVEVALVLDHPHIASLYEVGGASHQLFVALEYVEGGGLHHLASGRALAPAEAAAVVELLARAVHHAHERGLVHCHLQMANVLMGRRDPAPDDPNRPGLLAHHDPKIIGFEMAQRRDDRAGGQGSLTTVRPTSYAMAPEQLFSRFEEIGPATDVYALGVLLYELLTGQPPYRAATTSDLLLKVGFEVLLPPDRVNLDVPAGVDAVCMKCLERAPADRYATALALAEDLARFRRGERTLAQGKPFWERVKGWFRGLLRRKSGPPPAP
jgi:serine/threonine protein kinase